MGLGDELLQAGLVTPEQLDEGVRAQVLYGGRLGTNLVELGHLDLDDLAEALGQHHGLACALDRHFLSADERLQAEMPPPLAAELNAIPLSELTAEPRLVAVAFQDPPEHEVLDRIGAALKAEVVPVITPELRMRYQLERVYGLPRPTRFIRVRKPSDPPPLAPEPGRERRRYLPTLSDTEPDGMLGRIPIEQKVVRRNSAPPVEAEQIDAAAALDEALAGIRRATDRDRVVDLAVSCMRDGFDRGLGAGVMFLVRNDTAIGWRGFAAEAPDNVVTSIAIPLDDPSVLRLAYQSGVLVCGKAPPAGELIDRRLWKLLGAAQPPLECVVAPVRVADHIPCLLYAHARDLGAIDSDVSHDVGALAEATGAAFVRLIRAANR